MKKLLTGLGAALLLTVGALAAGDSLISVRYLTDIFSPQLESAMALRAAKQTETIAQEAQTRLDEIASPLLDPLADWSYSPYFEPLVLKRGDTITLSSGSGLLWRAGRGTAAAGLVDVTAGSEPGEGEELTAWRRYLNGVEGAVTVTVLSDRAELDVEGFWLLAGSGESVTQFTDLTQSTDWFYDGARFVVDRGIFNGMTETTFEPRVTVNRAMLATILYRLEGEPETAWTGRFSDVPDGAWYAPAVEWAASAGIVLGFDDGTFRPAAPISREGIAVMFHRYLGGFLGLDVSAAGDLSLFSDADQISSWAADALAWAVGAGVIGGTDVGTVEPLSSATRAEAAVLLRNLLQWMEAV